MSEYKLLTGGAVRRIADGAVIPFDIANADYRDYLRWVAAGNTAQPSDPETEPETPPTEILLALLADVTDVDETKPILEAMIMMLGGQV